MNTQLCSWLRVTLIAIVVRGSSAFAEDATTLSSRLSSVRAQIQSALVNQSRPTPEMLRSLAAIVTEAVAAGESGIARAALESVSFGEAITAARAEPQMVEAAATALASRDPALTQSASNILQSTLLLLETSPELRATVFAAARSGLDDPNPFVVLNCLELLAYPHATIDPVRLEKFLRDPDVAMAALYQNDVSGFGRSAVDRERVVRGKALWVRIEQGTLREDLAVYPTLRTTGQQAAADALVQFLMEMPPNPSLADEEIAADIAAFLIDQFGLPNTEWRGEEPKELEHLNAIAWGLRWLVGHTSQGAAPRDVLDLIEGRLTARRNAIMAQPDGSSDPRLAPIESVLSDIPKARETLNPLPPPGTG